MHVGDPKSRPADAREDASVVLAPRIGPSEDEPAARPSSPWEVCFELDGVYVGRIRRGVPDHRLQEKFLAPGELAVRERECRMWGKRRIAARRGPQLAGERS